MKSFIVWLLEFITSLIEKFKPIPQPQHDSVPAPEPEPEPVSAPEPFRIPHLPVNPDWSLTPYKVNISDVIERWFTGWSVPVAGREWAKSIFVDIRDSVFVVFADNIAREVPAACYYWELPSRIEIEAKWLNDPGTLVHEIAHIPWFTILTPEQQAEYEVLFNRLISTDPYMKLLDAANDYMNTSVIEGYAEVYRYLGEQMPVELKIYYPKLF